MNQNTWPSAGGSSEQASLQTQAQALALQLSLSGNLDQVLHLLSADWCTGPWFRNHQGSAIEGNRTRCHDAVMPRNLRSQGIGGIAPQQIAALAQQQQLQNLTQQLQSQLSLSNMNLSFFNQVRPAPPFLLPYTRPHALAFCWRCAPYYGISSPLLRQVMRPEEAEVSSRAAHHRYACRL